MSSDPRARARLSGCERGFAMPPPHKPRPSDADRAEVPRAAHETSASSSPYSIQGSPTPDSDTCDSYSESSPAPARARASPVPVAGSDPPLAPTPDEGPPSLSGLPLTHAQLQARVEAEAEAAAACEPDVCGDAHSPSPSSPAVEESADYPSDDSAQRRAGPKRAAREQQHATSEGRSSGVASEQQAARAMPPPSPSTDNQHPR